MFTSLFRLGATGVPLGRVRGVTIEAHWSLIFLALYFPVVFAGLLRGWFPELSTAAVTALALATAPVTIVGTALHELGHMFQARREGLPAERTILWAFGGVAFTGGFGRSPGADFRITAAGPLVSLVLALAFGGLAWLADGAGAATWLVALLVIVTVDNALGFAFNLAPAYPLDGGRMLHASLWQLRGFSTASRWAPRVGVAVGLLLVAVGAIGPFVDLLEPSYVGSAGRRSGLDGLTIMLAGVILATLAHTFRPPSELRQLTLRARAVGDLLQPTPVMPAPGTPVSGFLDRLIREGGQSAATYPVVEEGRVLGLISPGMAAAALDDDPDTDVADVMVRKEDAAILRPEMTIAEAYAAFRDDTPLGVVIHEDLVVGILRRSDVAAALLEEKEARNGSIVKAEPEPVRVDW